MERSQSDKPPSLQVVLLVGRTLPELSAQCRRAAATARLHLKESDVASATMMVARYRPRAIVMTHEQYAVDPLRFDAMASEGAAKLVRLESEDVDGADLAASFRAFAPASQSGGVLEDDGFGVVVAFSGEQAWTMLQTHAPRPDVLLLDLVMPDGNGWSLMKRIRRE